MPASKRPRTLRNESVLDLVMNVLFSDEVQELAVRGRSALKRRAARKREQKKEDGKDPTL